MISDALKIVNETDVKAVQLYLSTEYLKNCDLRSKLYTMDEIMSFKEKHMRITDSQIKDLLQSQIKLIDHVKNKQHQHCNEDEIKIQELTAKVATLGESLESEKRALEHKNHILSEELDYITELEAEKTRFSKENHSLEIQRNKLKACKINLKDQQLLDQGRRKYSLYKEFTGIRWDYEKLKETVAGYVSNKRDYIHHFSFPNGSTEDLNNLLWQEIYQSTVHTQSMESQNKENIVHNK